MKHLALVLGGVVLFAGGLLLGRMVSATQTEPLRVESNPPGASIFVDGTYRGRTPAALDNLADGQHMMRLIAKGHQPARTVITTPSEATVSLSLDPVPPARLSVTSQPLGATVILNGHVRGRTPLSLDDLPPGQYAVELTATNHIPGAQTLALAPGGEGTVHLTLEHRQVRAYEQRLAQDPGELGAYNDLGELLFVLERYEESAAAYVRGLVATAAYASRDEANRYNARKFKTLTNRTDPKGKFQDALSRAVIEAVSKGETAPMLLDYFMKVDLRTYRESYLDAFQNLVLAHPNNATFMEQYLAALDRMDEPARIPIVAAKALEVAGNKPLQVARIVDVMFNAVESEKDEELVKLIDKALGVLKELKPTGEAHAEWLYQRARREKLHEDAAAWMTLLTQAHTAYGTVVEAYTKNHPGRLAVVSARHNEITLHLIQARREAKQIKEALKLCEELVKSGDRRDPSVRRARSLRYILRRELRELPDN